MTFQAEAAMLIHKSPQQVFDAMVNPEVMSKIWFTQSTGPIEAGKTLKWTWEMYNVSADVHVESIEAPTSSASRGLPPTVKQPLKWSLHPWQTALSCTS